MVKGHLTPECVCWVFALWLHEKLISLRNQNGQQPHANILARSLSVQLRLSNLPSEWSRLFSASSFNKVLYCRRANISFFFFIQDGQHLIILSSPSAQKCLCGPTFFSGCLIPCSEFYQAGRIHRNGREKSTDMGSECSLNTGRQWSIFNYSASYWLISVFMQRLTKCIATVNYLYGNRSVECHLKINGKSRPVPILSPLFMMKSNMSGVEISARHYKGRVIARQSLK